MLFAWRPRPPRSWPPPSRRLRRRGGSIAPGGTRHPPTCRSSARSCSPVRVQRGGLGGLLGGPSAASAFWIGLDGYSSPSVEQIGTDWTATRQGSLSAFTNEITMVYNGTTLATPNSLSPDARSFSMRWKNS
jgi:hypothetical protein